MSSWKYTLFFAHYFEVKVGKGLLIKYVTWWAKTWHIPHFMKTEIRPEICIPMCSCSAENKNGSDWLLGSQATERKASRTWNATFRENAMFLHCYVSPYTFVLQKIDTCFCKKAAWKSPKTVWKDSGCESGGLHCVYRWKDNCIQTGSRWKCVFWKRIPWCPKQRAPVFRWPACHSSLYRLCSSRAGLHNSLWYNASLL